MTRGGCRSEGCFFDPSYFYRNKDERRGEFSLLITIKIIYNLKMSQKIALIQGGISSEREVSKKTGEAFANALDQLGYEYEIVDAKEDLPKVLCDLRPAKVLNALHGKWAEDGVVQGICEYLKIPYSGCGVMASAIGMDKSICKQIWERNGIQTAMGYVLDTHEVNLESVEAEINAPLVVKPARDGSSVGISICETLETWKEALKLGSKYDRYLIVESFIAGDEVAVGVLGEKALTPIEIVPRDGYYDYTNKYTSGMTDYFLPPRFSEDVINELKQIALKAHNCIGARSYSRVDFRVRDKKDIFILEINTLPGCTETSLVPKTAAHDGIPFTEFVKQLVDTARLDYEGVD